MNFRRLAGILAVPLLLSACRSNLPPRPSASPPLTSVGPSGPSGSPSSGGAGPSSAEAARERLCRQPPLPPPSKGPVEGRTPPVVAEVERDVEEIRGLRFEQPVVPDAVTHAKLVAGLRRSFARSFPSALYRRRSLVWRTIGVIPPDTSIERAIRAFGSSQVIGYYDSSSGELVFIGTRDPSPAERVTLAHELTHALDDQHYDLTRLDRLSARCEDERAAAALAVIEGNATYVMLQYARRFLSPQEQVELGLGALGGGASTAGIPPFIVAEEGWSYTAGLAFIAALVADGGEREVDRAFERFPVSSEQIIHPSKYPDDVPTAVDVWDLSSKLGRGWKDLDVQDVGEEWLANMLKLRLDASTSATATAGWDGGIYRAWTDGSGHVAVVLSTVWDTPDDATEFASAMTRWIGAGNGQRTEVQPIPGSRVRVLFTSDARTMSRLKAAV